MTLPYKVVPDTWRERIPRKKVTRNNSPTDDPIVHELLKGNTVIVDACLPLERKGLPYKNLYNFMSARGYRLRMYIYDDIDIEIYRGLIMWVEPFVQVVKCLRCGILEVTSFETMPSTKGCMSEHSSVHRWKVIKKATIEEEEIAA